MLLEPHYILVGLTNPHRIRAPTVDTTEGNLRLMRGCRIRIEAARLRWGRSSLGNYEMIESITTVQDKNTR